MRPAEARTRRGLPTSTTAADRAADHGMMRGMVDGGLTVTAPNSSAGSTLPVTDITSGGRVMAAIKKLAKFTITEAGEGFNLHIEDEAGHVLELTATRDQLDIIDDALAEILEESEDADEVGG